MWGTLPAFYLRKFVRFSNYPAGFKKFCISFFCHNKKFPPCPLDSKISGEAIINTMCDIAPQGKPHDFNLRKSCKKIAFALQCLLCSVIALIRFIIPISKRFTKIYIPTISNNKSKSILYSYLVTFLHRRLLIIFNRFVLIFSTLATPAISRFSSMFYAEDYSSIPPFCTI